MSLTRREAIAAMIGGAAGWAAGCGAGQVPVRSQAKLDRLEAARRRRRIIFVDDNYGLSHEGSDTPEGFLAPRLKPLIGTQVDAITYAVYAHSPAYISKARRRLYAAAGGTSVTDQAWAGNHKALVDAGHDPLKLVVDFAHENGMEAFAHMSMNDCHDSIMRNLMHPFKSQHPELLVDTEGTLPNLQLYVTAYDFTHEAVRDRQFTIVREVCEGFDVDGFEMDYIRHPMFFSRCMRGEPATPEETAIMTGFMARIREMADAAATRRGKPILLSARVPDTFRQAIHLGMDVEEWMAQDLVDLIIGGGGYASSTLDVEHFVRTAHEHDVRVYPCINQKPWSCDPAWCREGNRALAARWHRAGADGIHFWNLATPFDPYSVDTPEELAAVRNRVYACLDDVGEAETLEGRDKLYCVDSSVFIHYQHVTAEPPLPLHLRPGQGESFPLPLGDDVQAAAKNGTLRELRLELTLHGHLQEGGLDLSVNGQSAGAGEAVRIGYAHSHKHRHEADGNVSPHSHYHFQAHQVTWLLDAQPLNLGDNELELLVASSSDPFKTGGPLQLVNAQLWVRFSNDTSVNSSVERSG